MRNHLNSEILEGIRRNDPQVLQYIYKTFYDKVYQYIRRNNGTEADAEDVFQEALVIIYQKIRFGELVLTSSFKTFFFAICRHLWLQQLQQKKLSEEIQIYSSGDEDVFRITEDMFQSIDENASRRFIQKYFLKLGEGCQKILQLYAQGMSYRKIAENMGVTEKFVKKRKYECKEMLIEMIKKDHLLNFTSMMIK